MWTIPALVQVHVPNYPAVPCIEQALLLAVVVVAHGLMNAKKDTCIHVSLLANQHVIHGYDDGFLCVMATLVHVLYQQSIELKDVLQSMTKSSWRIVIVMLLPTWTDVSVLKWEMVIGK